MEMELVEMAIVNPKAIGTTYHMSFAHNFNYFELMFCILIMINVVGICIEIKFFEVHLLFYFTYMKESKN